MQAAQVLPLGSRVLALQWASPVWWVMPLITPSLGTLTHSPFLPLRWVYPFLLFLSFFLFFFPLWSTLCPPHLFFSQATLFFTVFPSFPSFLVFSWYSLVSCQTLDDDPIPTTNNNNQWQSQPILEWNNQQVCLWLSAMNMDQYTSEFATRGVDGTQLLNMDSETLKVSSCNHVKRNKMWDAQIWLCIW